MPKPSDQPRPSENVLARMLAAIAMALFILYIANVLARILPLRVLLASWQLEFSASLIDAAPIALLGLILVHLSAHLAPGSPILRRRKQIVARCASAAVLGFLLLIPLNVYAVWSGLSDLEAAKTNVEAEAGRKINQFRQLVSSARNSDDLQQRLESIGVPGLKSSELRLPLPQLKQLLLANLDRAQGKLEARKDRGGSLLRQGLWSLIQSVLKLIIGSLALAVAFAAGAQGHDTNTFLLESWQSILARRSRRSGVGRPKAAVVAEDYSEDLSRGTDRP